YGWRALASLVIGVLLFVAVRRAFRERPIHHLGLAFAVGLAVVFALGIGETLGWFSLDGYRAIGDSDYEARLHSLFFHSGWLMEYWVLCLPLAVTAAFAAGRRWAVLGWLVLGLGLVVLPLSGQRGGWAAVAVQLAIAALLSSRWLRFGSRAWLAPVAVVAVAAAALAGVLALRPELKDSLSERVERLTYADNRMRVWSSSVEMAEDRPWLGWGVGTFAAAFRAHPASARAYQYDWLTAHNHYLMWLVERGVAGLLALSALGWALVVAILASRRSRDAVWALAFAVTFSGAVVYGLVQYLFFVKAVEWAFWIVLGSAAAALPGRSRLAERLALVAAVGAVALMPWRAMRVEAPVLHGDRSYGFHGVEGGPEAPFEWTEGRAARRLAWEDEVLVVPLANGHPRAGERPIEVRLLVDGVEVARRGPGSGWEEVAVPLGAPAREAIVLEIRARPTFRPFSDFRSRAGVEASRDIRSLGVAVGALRWQAAD
ncbi:MAG: O-antigen ligase family protein, partial [Thermoanaerobaculia bacterium]|nr:O-antigen ligase family protein [Thermoanaerobaculia bacterium]